MCNFLNSQLPSEMLKREGGCWNVLKRVPHRCGICSFPSIYMKWSYNEPLGQRDDEDGRRRQCSSQGPSGVGAYIWYGQSIPHKNTKHTFHYISSNGLHNLVDSNMRSKFVSIWAALRPPQSHPPQATTSYNNSTSKGFVKGTTGVVAGTHK